MGTRRGAGEGVKWFRCQWGWSCDADGGDGHEEGALAGTLAKVLRDFCC